MTNELQIIDQREVLGKEFMIYGTVENPLFLAKQVADWIEHTDLSRMVNLVDDDEKLKRTLYVSGQNREMWFLSEDGLYEVLMQSRKPIAKEFKKKVKEILRDIRQHGMYMTDNLLQQTLDNPDFMIELLTNYKEEKIKRKQLEVKNLMLEQEIAEAKPKLNYVDIVLKCTDLLTVTQIADDYGMSAKKFNQLLYNLKIQFKQSGQWLLYADHKGLGYTKSETTTYDKPDGSKGTKLLTKWTQKGRLFLYDKLKTKGILPTIEQDN